MESVVGQKMLSLILLLRRTSSAKDVKLFVLRHEVGVLGRTNPIPLLNRADRGIFAPSSGGCPPALRGHRLGGGRERRRLLVGRRGRDDAAHRQAHRQPSGHLGARMAPFPRCACKAARRPPWPAPPPGRQIYRKVRDRAVREEVVTIVGSRRRRSGWMAAASSAIDDVAKAYLHSDLHTCHRRGAAAPVTTGSADPGSSWITSVIQLPPNHGASTARKPATFPLKPHRCNSAFAVPVPARHHVQIAEWITRNTSVRGDHVDNVKPSMST
jgi:hypothetical protein